MTVKLPEKAGFMPTPDEWDALVRIAENLGAQVVQRDAALARVERERAELIETVARLRAEHNDAQAVARAYILRAEAAENKMLREMMDVDVVVAVMAERDAARAEVARLTAALKEYGWHLDNCPAADCSTTTCECGYAALRQPAPAGAGVKQ